MKAKLGRVKNMLLHNWHLKLASLFLAFVIWFIVAQVGDPQDTRPFSNIQVKLINTDLLENQNKYYEVLDRSDYVRVVVTAPTSVFQTLRASDIIAEADVSKLTDINTIAITYSTQNSNLEVVSVEGDHDVVKLNVEDMESKWVRVSYHTVGTVAEGYMISNISADQTVINVKGPQSIVSQIDGAAVEMNIDGATANNSANVDIRLLDKEGQVLESTKVEKSADFLHMSVEILPTKEVPVVIHGLSGQPADGYMVVGDALLSTESVLIAGNTANLAGVTRITIPEEKLDITNAEGDEIFSVNLKDCLPANIRLADSSFNGVVTVSVSVKAAREKTFEVPASNIIFRDVPAGFEVQAYYENEQDATVDARIFGLRESINTLRANSIRGAANVTEWMRKQNITELTPGIYQLPVMIEVDELMNVLEVGTIRVKISTTD